ncbi:nucleotidyltransferase domain-containing protein [Anseongella ginsenosidimutans]|nr:nucleotidyltransferase domain-containing protein [Anseongella ginsenosidimutans]
MPFGLSTSTIDRINAVLTSFTCVREATIYGSRAKGTYRAASDIDLTLKGEGLTPALVNKTSLRLDELALPYMIDLSMYERIRTPELVEHINRVGKVFYS